MKGLIVFLILIFSISNYATEEKVVYGEDNRVDVFESINSSYIKWSKATAAQIYTTSLKPYNSQQYRISGESLEAQGVCAEERFSQQSAVARCSGFLVSNNLLVTAGHCMQTTSDCNEASWVFDYKVEFSDQSEVIVSKDSVYKCKRVVSRAYDNSNLADYAVIELDRSVADRAPLDFRVKTGSKVGPYKGDRLVVIGHPSGLPTKIADGAQIRSLNSSIYFKANLDTFAGNSGSAVLNINTGKVEGILVRGDTDYVFDNERNCKVVNRVSNDGGTGEGVTRITTVSGLPR